MCKLFNYLGYNLSFDHDEEIGFKISNFLKVLGVINSTFKPSQVPDLESIKHSQTLFLCMKVKHGLLKKLMND